MSQRPDPTEREFYLRAFRHRCLVFHVTDPADLKGIGPVVGEFLDNGTQVVVVAPGAAGRDSGPGLLSGGGPPIRLTKAEVMTSVTVLGELVERLLETGGAWVLPRVRGKTAALEFSVALATRLGAMRIVVIDSRGGLAGHGRRRSFVSAKGMPLQSAPGLSGRAWSKEEVTVLRAAVLSGIDSINLAAASDLAEELLTYEGAGTLLTAEDYCSVRALGIEDFSEAERLIQRGEREGFLVPRGPDDRRRLLLTGYGAWFGVGRLAGLAGLEMEAYRRQRLAEIVGLYTITRFKGEGVGVQILQRLIEVARENGARALFACTSNARAAAFFERQGLALVDRSKVPATKWRGRKAKSRPQVYWIDL